MTKPVSCAAAGEVRVNFAWRGIAGFGDGGACCLPTSQSEIAAFLRQTVAGAFPLSRGTMGEDQAVGSLTDPSPVRLYSLYPKHLGFFFVKYS